MFGRFERCIDADEIDGFGINDDFDVVDFEGGFVVDVEDVVVGCGRRGVRRS